MIEDVIDQYLTEKNESERLKHVASGYLSAGKLDKSTLETVLYLLGVPTMEFTPYALKLFERGKQVEKWLEGVLTEAGMVERSQTELTYITPEGHTIVGIEDLTLKGEDFPTEIKSIKNSAYKYLDTEGARPGHILQACMYALAEGKTQARVLYVAADDLRTKQFIVKVSDYKSIIDASALRVYNSLSSGVLPQFEPLNEFQALEIYKDYTSYPDWLGTYSEQMVDKTMIRGGKEITYKKKQMMFDQPFTTAFLMDKLSIEHPEAFKKLKGGV